MIGDLKGIKKKVMEDWRNSFPQLTAFTQSKFYKIIGPVIAGIELIKLPRSEEYRPHFVIYSLWGNKLRGDLKASLEGPILLKEFYNKKGLQFSIPYVKHDLFLPEVIECVREQMPILLDRDISLKDLFAVFDGYSKSSPLSAAPNSFLQAEVQAMKLYLSLYTGSNDQIQNVLNQIKTKTWDLGHFAMCNIDYDNWLAALHERVNHRDKFMNQIDSNKKDKKMLRLQRSELKI